MPLTNPMPPMDAKTLIIVSLRDISISPEFLELLSVGMKATSTEKISDKVALRGLPDIDYTPSRSGRYSGYKVQFGSADEANRAHACLNLHVTKNIAPYNTLFVFKPPQGEDRFSLFCIGTWVRHITVFSKTQERSQVFDILAQFGAVSFLYPDEKAGWIVHFETEVEAYKAESKILRAYDASAIQRVEIDPHLDHLNAKLKLEIIGLSSRDLARISPTRGNLTVATRDVVFNILLPLILLARVVTGVRILGSDFEKPIAKVNEAQLSTALVRVSRLSGEVERFDVIAEETVAKEEAFRSQIATLQVEFFLQKLVTGDNLNKLEDQEERNREQFIKLKAAQEEVITLKLEVEELGRKISEGEFAMRAAQQEIVELIMKAEGEGRTKGRMISTNKRCVEAAQEEIVKLKRELTEARKSQK